MLENLDLDDLAAIANSLPGPHAWAYGIDAMFVCQRCYTVFEFGAEPVPSGPCEPVDTSAANSPPQPPRGSEMCFIDAQSTDLVTIELSAEDVRQYIADIDNLRDLRIRLKKLLEQLDAKNQTAQQIPEHTAIADAQELTRLRDMPGPWRSEP